MSRRTLITGGAGFIGTNLADRLARRGEQVVIVDDLSRPGVEENLRWLVREHGARVEVMIGSITERLLLRDALRNTRSVYHLAAQVAVTTSLRDPEADFRVNLEGTFNLLEAMRSMERPPRLLFTSTNKVYGDLDGVPLARQGQRYCPTEARYARGVSEAQTLSFHSPYGCSKGGADQYVLDFCRVFGLEATVFRMSCIYGPHQHGTEDQGWVAHFLLCCQRGEPITIYGDGRQVRDILFVGDLLDAFELAMKGRDATAGRAFNIGGGRERAVSLLELMDRIADLRGSRPDVRFADWRPGDQRWYVSDTSAFERATGWKPRVTVGEGLMRLHEWLRAHRTGEPRPGARPLAAAL